MPTQRGRRSSAASNTQGFSVTFWKFVLVWYFQLGYCLQILKVSKIDCLRLVMCLLLAPIFRGFFFVVAINSTNEANKAGGMCLQAVYITYKSMGLLNLVLHKSPYFVTCTHLLICWFLCWFTSLINIYWHYLRTTGICKFNWMG